MHTSYYKMLTSFCMKGVMRNTFSVDIMMKRNCFLEFLLMALHTRTIQFQYTESRVKFERHASIIVLIKSRLVYSHFVCTVSVCNLMVGKRFADSILGKNQQMFTFPHGTVWLIANPRRILSLLKE